MSNRDNSSPDKKPVGKRIIDMDLMPRKLCFGNGWCVESMYEGEHVNDAMVRLGEALEELRQNYPIDEVLTDILSR